MREYFPHDFDAHADLRIQQLLSKCGAIAYSVFWCVIEYLHRERKLDAKSCYNLLARTLNTDAKTVENCIAGMIEFGLLSNDNGILHSDRVNANIEKRNELSGKRSEAATRRYANAVQLHNTVDANALQLHSNKENKSKEKKSKDEERINVANATNRSVFLKPTTTELEAYMAEIGLPDQADAFRDHYAACGWKVGNKPMKDWRAACRNWKRQHVRFALPPAPPSKQEIAEHFEMQSWQQEHAEAFYTHYTVTGWKVGNGQPIANWKAKAAEWVKTQTKRGAQ